MHVSQVITDSRQLQKVSPSILLETDSDKNDTCIGAAILQLTDCPTPATALDPICESEVTLPLQPKGSIQLAMSFIRGFGSVQLWTNWQLWLCKPECCFCVLVLPWRRSSYIGFQLQQCYAMYIRMYVCMWEGIFYSTYIHILCMYVWHTIMCQRVYLWSTKVRTV